MKLINHEEASIIKDGEARKPKHATLDDSPITPEQWADYDRRMEEWRETYKDRLHTMDADMSKPNPPNYFRANND